MKKSKKEFDAVNMMREIRDKLSKEFSGMSYDEQKKYIKERTKPRKVHKNGAA
ncbi:MAG TPA: hypothetical protein VE439_09920 [Anaerolineae bacterium]|jgi:hypothetical protein|nr:hypothetical protein [Anaerolineae bacterium]